MNLPYPVGEKSSSVLKEVLRLGFVFAMLGSILFTFLLVGLSLLKVNLRLGHAFQTILYNQFCLGIVGAGFGQIFGSFLGLVDGVILELLVSRGRRNPYTSRSDLRLFCVISALVTGSLTCVILSAFSGVWQHILMATMIAAIGGWWVAYRVFTRKPPVMEPNPPTLSHESQ